MSRVGGVSFDERARCSARSTSSNRRTGSSWNSTPAWCGRALISPVNSRSPQAVFINLLIYADAGSVSLNGPGPGDPPRRTETSFAHFHQKFSSGAHQKGSIWPCLFRCPCAETGIRSAVRACCCVEALVCGFLPPRSASRTARYIESYNRRREPHFLPRFTCLARAPFQVVRVEQVVAAVLSTPPHLDRCKLCAIFVSRAVRVSCVCTRRPLESVAAPW